jgi:hypothetical protein
MNKGITFFTPALGRKQHGGPAHTAEMALSRAQRNRALWPGQTWLTAGSAAGTVFTEMGWPSHRNASTRTRRHGAHPGCREHARHATRHSQRWLAGAPWAMLTSPRALTRRRAPTGQGPIGGGKPERPDNERGDGVAAAMVGYGMDKGEDSHRKVWRGPYEQEEGTAWLHDIAEEQRRYSGDAHRMGEMAAVQQRWASVSVG